MRALRIALRTAHIGAASLLLGAVHFAPDSAALTPWVMALLLTGATLLATELTRHGLDWLRFAQGWAVLVKLSLVVLGAVYPEALHGCLWGALILGSVLSHAPGRVRHWALWGEDGPCATPP